MRLFFATESSTKRGSVSDFNDLREIYAQDTDLASLMRAYDEVALFYGEALAVMQVPGQPVAPVRNSAEVTVSFGQEMSTAFEFSIDQ